MRALLGAGQVVQGDIPSAKGHLVASLFLPVSAVDAEKDPITLRITGPDQAVGSSRHDLGVRGPGHGLDCEAADLGDRHRREQVAWWAPVDLKWSQLSGGALAIMVVAIERVDRSGVVQHVHGRSLHAPTPFGCANYSRRDRLWS
jgi:hypothetical protein